MFFFLLSLLLNRRNFIGVCYAVSFSSRHVTGNFLLIFQTVVVDDKNKDKLGIANVGGVFLLLILGCVFAFFVAILEFLWNVRKVAVKEKVIVRFCRL